MVIRGSNSFPDHFRDLLMKYKLVDVGMMNQLQQFAIINYPN